MMFRIEESEAEGVVDKMGVKLGALLGSADGNVVGVELGDDELLGLELGKVLG
jgi:NADPH-dependent glutamate synthase beta subunit-like oxidoreductase